MEEIILYSTGCPKCLILEKKLKEKNITYTKITDVEKMKELGFRTVPILNVDGDLKDFARAIEYVNGKE